MVASYCSEDSPGLGVKNSGNLGSSFNGAYMSNNAAGQVTGVGSDQRPRRLQKIEVAEAFINNLRGRNNGNIDVDAEGFADSIKEHFLGLPSRYALDVNIASLDVLNHKRLLDSARTDSSAVSFQVRPVDVMGSLNDQLRKPSFGSLDSLAYRESIMAQLSPHKGGSGGGGGGRTPLPRPAFGSSPNLQALVSDAEERIEAKGGDRRSVAAVTTFYEVTIASIDQPKLLSRLSECLGDLNLNICEAHAFNTKDRFALDVFVVNGWIGGGCEELEEVLSERLQELPPPGTTSPRDGDGDNNNSNINNNKHGGGGGAISTKPLEPEARIPAGELEYLRRASLSAENDWELDPSELIFAEKIASGAFGDLFRGSYCGQEVAIKILRGVQDDSLQFQEFLQEVAIMRKVRHKNVVQFIGACTKKPNLFIVFEYMPGGSVYDFVRRVGSPLPVVTILRIALEVARGMDYLHKRKIVHRDLKAANLLLDDTGVVKIADFGVARVLDGAGVMTAETGTYRWMAPEVIEHAPYGAKADVFSFGIVLWELLTGKVPYSELTPLQAAVGVVQKGLRPPLPPNCPPPLADMIRLCWQKSPDVRPTFESLKVKLEELYEAYRQQEGAERSTATPTVGTGQRQGQQGTGGLLSRLRGRQT